MSKSSENRLRRIAKRRGYILRKSPRRDPGALDYGLYAVVDIQTKELAHPRGVISDYALTVALVDQLLSGAQAVI